MNKGNTWFWMFLTLLAVPIAIALVGGGCAGMPDAPDNWTSIADKGGAQLWTENCARCHNSRSPSEFSDAQWDIAMTHMRTRAGLTSVETEKIVKFLQSGN